jgi:diguanylate cyclase (GGDEF)-like protein/PAS domain S-box-containing protein
MNQITEKTLGDVVQRDVPRVAPDCTLGEAVQQMAHGHISSILVIENRKPVGILTERDLVKLLSQHTPATTPIEKVMSHPVLTAPISMDVNTAYAWLLNQRIRHLIVMDEQQNVVGIASENDFRRQLGFNVLNQLDQLDSIIDKKLPLFPPHATLNQALDLMLRNQVPYVIIAIDNRPVGILSECDTPDLLLQFPAGNIDQVPLSSVMHTIVPTTHYRQSVSEIVTAMQTQGLSYIIVLDDDGQIMGVVTLHNLLGRITSMLLNQRVKEEQSSLELSLHQTTDRLNMIVEAAHLGFWELDLKTGALFYSESLRTLTGFDEQQVPHNLQEWMARIHKDDVADVMRKFNSALYSDQLFDMEYRIPNVHGEWMWLHVRGKAIHHDASNNAVFAVGTAMDITARKLQEVESDNERHILELLAKSLPLHSFLNELVLGYESIFSDVLCSILLLDSEGKRLRHAAAPNLPKNYIDAIDGIEIGAYVGSCGTAAYTGKLTIVEDIVHNPLWKDYRKLAEAYQLAACWSIPILSTQGNVLGTFALYFRTPHSPQPSQINVMQRAAHFASLAIERAYTEQSLRKNKENLKRAQTVAETGSWLIDITTGEIEWSDEAYRIFGVPHLQSVNLALFFSYIHPEDQAQVMLAWNAALAGELYDIEHRILVHGKVRYVRERAQFERDAAGNPIRGIGTVQDITEQHKTRETMNMLSMAVEQSYNSIVITDLDANIQYANAAFTKTTGYTLDEVKGKNPRILQSGKTAKSTYGEMWARVTAGKSWKGELLNRRKDGREYHESIMVSPVRQTDGRVTHYLAIKEDLTKLKEAEKNIQHLSNFDVLTGLPNRTLLNERVNFAINLSQHTDTSFALLFLDLDHFKYINDNLGHRVGDTLLVELSMRLKSAIRQDDTLSRMGGDEFVFVLPDTDADHAARLSEKLLDVIAQTCRIEQQDLVVTASIGIAMYPENGNSFDVLAQCADVAMYRAKQNGRNMFRFFTPEMQSHSARQLLLENALRQAIARNQLYLHYQPQISMQDGKVIGAEVLLRWEHPELGNITPSEFIPIAEDSGQILQIGEWVLRTAMAQLKNWIQAGMSPICIAVNLSAIQFHNPQLPDLVTEILLENQIAPHCLELELTESVAMDNPAGAIAIMNNLHQRGVTMSIDDFGTGYSSLSYLKRFKVNKLKIDQSFVRHLTEDLDDKAIVTAIINMANSLGFHTIAEGVETSAQLAFLRMQGCDEVQGYFFSRPLSVIDFEHFVEDNRTV